MPLRWMIGHEPIFTYCVICDKTIFYPLNHKLTGTNMCLPCHKRVKRKSGELQRVKTRIWEVTSADSSA